MLQVLLYHKKHCSDYANAHGWKVILPNFYAHRFKIVREHIDQADLKSRMIDAYTVLKLKHNGKYAIQNMNHINMS